MPLHLILIMIGLVGFLLWLAFADGEETDQLGLAEGPEDDGSRQEPPARDARR